MAVVRVEWQGDMHLMRREDGCRKVAIFQLFVLYTRTINIALTDFWSGPCTVRDELTTGVRTGARHFQNWSRTISSKKKTPPGLTTVRSG